MAAGENVLTRLATGFKISSLAEVDLLPEEALQQKWANEEDYDDDGLETAVMDQLISQLWFFTGGWMKLWRVNLVLLSCMRMSRCLSTRRCFY